MSLRARLRVLRYIETQLLALRACKERFESIVDPVTSSPRVVAMCNISSYVRRVATPPAEVSRATPCGDADEALHS